MPIHHVEDIPKSFIRNVKETTKRSLLEHAMKDHHGTQPSDWVFRELVLGDSAVTDFYDLDYKTAALGGHPQFVIDAADLTADDLSSFLAAGETVPNKTYIGIYGFMDLAVEAGELTGTATTPPPNGAVVSMEFKRGGSVLDFWQIEHLYSYPYVVGITDRPIIYEQDEKIDWKLCATEATEDKSVGVRAYVCEPYGQHISPDIDVLRANPYVGGIDPIQELTLEEIAGIEKKVQNELFRRIAKSGNAENINDARKKYVIRELVVGDESDATDFVDLDFSATAQTVGQQNWAEDSTALTGGDLKNVFATGEKVPDNKFIGIFGLFDKTPNPDLIGASLKDGAGRKEFWQPEHLYAYPTTGTVIGYTHRPVFFDENVPIEFHMNVKTAKDEFVGLRAYIAERWGEIISER